MIDLVRRADQRRRRALVVIEELGLMERWSRYGKPVMVGAVRIGLVVDLDIDIEVYSQCPRIDDGFKVMSKLALLPGVWKVRFSNELEGPDQGLYWQIRHRDGLGDVWKIDTWLVGEDHPDAHHSERFADAMEKALTDETRTAILGIKEALLGRTEVRGVDVYKAVLRDGVRSPEEFIRWTSDESQSVTTHWLPEPAGNR